MRPSKSWQRRHSFIIITIVLVLWLLAELPWLRSVPVNVFNECVMHQNDAVNLYRAFQGEGWQLFLEKLTTMDGPCSPFTDTLNMVGLCFCPNGPWPWFATQFIFLVFLVFGCECLGSLMHNPRTGLYSALTVCSLMMMESYLRSPYVDFSMATVVTWSYWAYLKSEHFTKARFNVLFALLTLVGMLCKWSYLPLFLGFFLFCIFARSLILRTFTKRDFFNLLLYTAGVAIPAYFLYYGTALHAILGNYTSCTSLSADKSYLLDPHFYWHCLGKYLILLIRNDYLTIAGQLSLVAFGFTLVQPKRFRANLEPLLLFILPNIIVVLCHFEFTVPRYLVGCLGLQCVLIGSVLDRARYGLGVFFLTLMLAAKVVFLAAWMVPTLGVPNSNYYYLDGDTFHVRFSQNIFTMLPEHTEEALTPGIIVNTVLGARQNWCDQLNRNWFADLKRYGIFTGTFTSPPYHLPWLNNLDHSLTAIAKDTESLRHNPRGRDYDKPLSVTTFTNEMRNSICLRYAVNHALALNEVWDYNLEMCLDFYSAKNRIFAPKRAGFMKVLVMALMLDQQPNQGFPWPSRPIMERRQAAMDRVKEELGPDWYVYAFYPNQRQRVVPRATMNKEFDLVIVREKATQNSDDIPI